MRRQPPPDRKRLAGAVERLVDGGRDLFERGGYLRFVEDLDRGRAFANDDDGGSYDRRSTCPTVPPTP
jgi:hypothetical protein